MHPANVPVGYRRLQHSFTVIANDVLPYELFLSPGQDSVSFCLVTYLLLLFILGQKTMIK